MKASEFTIDGKVLVVKCNDSKCLGHDGFDWSDKTEVDIGDKWNPAPVCDDVGYYGWAWGIGVGCGKRADVNGIWHVWEVLPDDIVSFDGKAKWKRGKRVFVGCYAEAMKFTMAGRQKFIAQESNSSASASGDYGSASASGYYGSASASGDYGSASASGDQGSASASGDQGSASASGNQGSASASGNYGSASASGYQGSASASGDYGSASASGNGGIASVTVAKQGSIISSGPGGICAAIGETFKWKVHVDSVLIQRWIKKEKIKTAVLYPKKLKLETGATVVVNKGKIVK
jgi:hypothetical protein